ncbi:aldehyde dehydrogenase (NAD+) [Actinokineospora alba]|uniref:aldehyde dehydrogenase (NAD(+)) n=1 Tax=Actinokineospora alba TaxID=504798 RepID=A0A1H0KHP7_9PSEU|nr:aldehyde dehydrogenase family protein [Actinokineospora alba]TDP67896.1 aldehyde dehydrogenase (NAD+) [Actinokineospora alba]SDH88378.1 aldehyde dehydrogenase (NAD+) [Actinokineospora alba]SDO55469.1 aldehyde dehydrogenase (NAD+) [Actinokineospora alba]
MSAPVTTRTGHVIGGRLVDGAGERIDVVNPATEEVIASVPAGTAADVDAAVEAATAAFAAWSATSPADRAAAIRRVSEGIAARRDELAATITAEMGSPLSFSTKVQASLPAATSAGIASLIENGYSFAEEIGNSLVLREPVGVVGAITPWNYPLHQIVAKVAPALAAGNTVVLKPSEVAPLNANLFLEILAEAGIPAGVVNLVHGTGPVVGEAISRHPGIDMVSFTGSTNAGKLVTQAASETVKRVALELGGKSANVVLDDADLARAVKIGVANTYINGGQTCTAWTRMLVPAALHDQAVELAAAAAAKYTVGDPLDAATRVGPMSSAAQRDRVLEYIKVGQDEGATVAYSAADLPERGAYAPPTVFAGVRQDMRIAQEEIFGPVLSILPYADEDEAVSIANSTIYGLAGAVFSGDQDRAIAVAKRLRTGQVDVNGGAFNALAPFGGYKQSGNGRELGKYGLEEFTEVKSIQR